MDGTTLPALDDAALVTIDVQRDTLDGQVLEIPGTSAAVPRIARLAAAFRTAGRPVVHVVRLYRADGSNAEPSRRELVSGATPVLRPGTPGRLPAPGLLPDDAGPLDLDDELLLAGGIQAVGPGEVVVYKPRWGAFFRTPLDDHLRSLGVTTIVFAGCNFPNCPRTSIYEASERDYAVAVADDAVSGLYDRGRGELAGIGVVLSTTDDLVAGLSRGSLAAPAWGTMDHMSIAVELERVQAEAAARGPGAFLLTVTDDGRPHVVAVTVGWDAGSLVMTAGRTSVRNAGGRPGVSVLWPPAEGGGYSLIVDGEAAASPNAAGDGGQVAIRVTRAVLHRPATDAGAAAPSGPEDATACSSDCVPLLRRA